MNDSATEHALLRYIEGDGPRSLVERVAADIRRWLLGERVAAGTRLPSVRDMATLRGVSADTIARAYDKLVAAGLLEARRGSGFYVRALSRQQTLAARASPSWTHTFSKWRDQVLHTSLPDEGLIGGGGLPALCFEGDLVGRALRHAGRTATTELLRHGHVAGLPALRKQIALQLASVGIHVGADEIVTTHGASDALHLLLQAFSAPTAPVLVEDPGNFALTERLASVNQRALPVARKDDGPDLDQLRQLCMQHQPRLLFLSSLAQNPTSTSLSPHKAFQLLKLADEFDLLLVDDDSYGELMTPRSTAGSVRVAALDQLQRVIHVGSYSKVLGAGLRVGFIAADAERARILCQHKGALGISHSELPERAVLRALTDGAYRHHLEQLRARLDQRRPLVSAWLRRCGFKVWHEATEGLYLWADLGPGTDARMVADAAMEHGLLLAPGLLFTVREEWQSYMRVNVAAPFVEADLRRVAAWAARAREQPPG